MSSGGVSLRCSILPRLAGWRFVLAAALLAQTALGQQSYRSYQQFPARVTNKGGRPSADSTTKHSFPARFHGWNHSLHPDPDYQKRFSRPRERVHRAERLKATAEAAARFQTPAQSFPPSELPGLLFRNSLPAGYIPDSVVTGDFNGDGKIDFAVANGGDSLTRHGDWREKRGGICRSQNGAHKPV